MVEIAYRTKLGVAYKSTIEDFLSSKDGLSLKSRVNLILTSPPFPLNRKKKYGNLQGDKYVEWLRSLAKPLGDLLTPDGSIVIEIGNAWIKGSPEMSILPMKSLMNFLEAGSYKLCQQFICYNPARLPTPAQWVTIERIRLKDSYTNVWWMSKTARPKASNKEVLIPYSKSMKTLFKNKKYNSGPRPSGHSIGKTSFFKDNGGAIAPNVLTVSNTNSADGYLTYCKENGLKAHPARMPKELPEFLIRMLTDEYDVVLDPFSGSNVTGFAAESLGRKWIAIESESEYIQGAIGRFLKTDLEVENEFGKTP